MHGVCVSVCVCVCVCGALTRTFVCIQTHTPHTSTHQRTHATHTNRVLLGYLTACAVCKYLSAHTYDTCMQLTRNKHRKRVLCNILCPRQTIAYCWSFSHGQPKTLSVAWGSGSQSIGGPKGLARETRPLIAHPHTHSVHISWLGPVHWYAAWLTWPGA